MEFWYSTFLLGNTNFWRNKVQPWKRRQLDPPKSWYAPSFHRITPHKSVS
jgi:hypothetical protein